MRGGRRLWESKDDRKWGHDKFEEISLQDRHYKEVMIDFCNLLKLLELFILLLEVKETLLCYLCKI